MISVLNKIEIHELRDVKYELKNPETFVLEGKVSDLFKCSCKYTGTLATAQGGLIIDYVGSRVEIYVHPGFRYDGPSGARDTKDFMVSSLIHDIFYLLMRMEILDRSFRKTADRVMKALNIHYGMSKFRAWYTYRAVRFGGRKNVFPEKMTLNKCDRVEV